MKKIAHGVFGWDAGERQTNRYGGFQLVDRPYEGPVAATPSFDRDSAAEYVGKRVRVVAKVVEARKSGHAGDKFLKCYPTTPDVGEEIVLGVGIFGLTTNSYDRSIVKVELEPEDGRRELWIDPRRLYRLHDQTVDLFVEETNEPCSPKAEFQESEADGMISNGDGSFQVKNVELSGRTRIHPRIESLGDGMFIMSPPASAPAGTRLDFDQNGRSTSFDRLIEEDEE